MLPGEKMVYAPELEDRSYPVNQKKTQVAGTDTQNVKEGVTGSPSKGDQHSHSSFSQHHTNEQGKRGLQAISESVDTDFSGQKETPEPAQVESPPNQHTSFFPSPSNFKVVGSHFSSFRDNVSTGNVIINVNSGSQPKESVSVRLPSGSVSESKQKILSNVEIKSSNLPIRIRKSSEIYFRHLLTLGYGSPLWIPEPSNTLPIEYQRTGIGIGDVGLLKESGGFDFLFNVYHPRNDAEHPINPRMMPDGFRPLDPPEERDVDSHSEFKNHSFLTSSHVVSRHDGSSGFIFESSAEDGAILTMPDGANSVDLENMAMVRKYVSQNVEHWYTYANETRGRDARNGDIRLVIGKTSATTWGMAVFNANRQLEDLEEKGAICLKFKPSLTRSGNTLGPRHTWEYSGKAEVKSGPDEHEIEKLRMFDRQRGDEVQATYENQCLFVRAINVTLAVQISRPNRPQDNIPQHRADDLGIGIKISPPEATHLPSAYLRKPVKTEHDFDVNMEEEESRSQSLSQDDTDSVDRQDMADDEEGESETTDDDSVFPDTARFFPNRSMVYPVSEDIEMDERRSGWRSRLPTTPDRPASYYPPPPPPAKGTPIPFSDSDGFSSPPFGPSRAVPPSHSPWMAYNLVYPSSTFDNVRDDRWARRQPLPGVSLPQRVQFPSQSQSQPEPYSSGSSWSSNFPRRPQAPGTKNLQETNTAISAHATASTSGTSPSPAIPTSPAMHPPALPVRSTSFDMPVARGSYLSYQSLSDAEMTNYLTERKRLLAGDPELEKLLEKLGGQTRLATGIKPNMFPAMRRRGGVPPKGDLHPSTGTPTAGASPLGIDTPFSDYGGYTGPAFWGHQNQGNIYGTANEVQSRQLSSHFYSSGSRPFSDFPRRPQAATETLKETDPADQGHARGARPSGTSPSEPVMSPVSFGLPVGLPSSSQSSAPPPIPPLPTSEDRPWRFQSADRWRLQYSDDGDSEGRRVTATTTAGAPPSGIDTPFSNYEGYTDTGAFWRQDRGSRDGTAAGTGMTNLQGVYASQSQSQTPSPLKVHPLRSPSPFFTEERATRRTSASTSTSVSASDALPEPPLPTLSMRPPVPTVKPFSLPAATGYSTLSSRPKPMSDTFNSEIGLGELESDPGQVVVDGKNDSDGDEGSQTPSRSPSPFHTSDADLERAGVPLDGDLHPSSVVNRFLLNTVPEATMAITEDRDWISVLQRTDQVFPSDDVLLSRIQEMNEVCVEDGVVFLRRRSQDSRPSNGSSAGTSTEDEVVRHE